MKLSLQSPPLPFTNGLPQTFPFYVRHMLLLELIANYHGLNDLTPPPSLQMIHIIFISISIIKSTPPLQILKVLYLMYPLRRFGNNYWTMSVIFKVKGLF